MSESIKHDIVPDGGDLTPKVPHKKGVRPYDFDAYLLKHPEKIAGKLEEAKDFLDWLRKKGITEDQLNLEELLNAMTLIKFKDDPNYNVRKDEKRFPSEFFVELEELSHRYRYELSEPKK